MEYRSSSSVRLPAFYEPSLEKAHEFACAFVACGYSSYSTDEYDALIRYENAMEAYCEKYGLKQKQKEKK